MEHWETLVNSYEGAENTRSFCKALQVAENVLKEDLAGFEIDWFLQTFLYKPVYVLDTIKERHRDDNWSKPLADTYKLLADIVSKFTERVEPWILKIIEVCSVRLDARTRAYSLHCLSACARTHLFGNYLEGDVGKRRVQEYIEGLEEGSACRAAMAIFIGTLCEYHPDISDDAIANEANRIWRIYLNMLESNKNTDTVISSVLQGVSGLLKNFGNDLPMAELNRFFNKMMKEYINISKCEQVIISIVSNYVSLFKEVVCSSRSIRSCLWSLTDSTAALTATYQMLAEEMNKEEIEKVISSELLPYTKHNYPPIKYTALRLIKFIDKRHGLTTEVEYDRDVYTLEFELRDQVSYEVAEAIAFSIECNLPNSDKILQAAILFYDNIPESKKKSIVVNGVLKSSPDMMMAHLNLLISECCQPATLESHLPLWKDILDSDLEQEKQIFVEMFVRHFVTVVDVFIDDCDEDLKLPEKIQNLLTLSSHVFTLLSPEFYSKVQCFIVLSKLVEVTRLCGLEACSIALLRSLVAHLENEDGLREMYNLISVERSKDETVMCESCLAVVSSPDGVCEDRDVLLGCEIILSRKDAEPKTLLKTLNKLENIIGNIRQDSELQLLRNILNHIEKIRNRKNVSGKDARILQRELTIFAGKYSNSDLNNNKVSSSGNMSEMKEMALEIPNTIEGVNYKLHLSRILELALIHEDEDTLKTILTAVRAQMSSSPSGGVSSACGWACVRAARVSPALCAAAGGLAPTTLDYITQYVVSESSPGVRKLLSDLVEGILMKEDTEQAARSLAEKVLSLMRSTDTKSKLAGLDLTEPLVTSLDDKNKLSKEILPSLIVTIAATNETETYTVLDKVAKLFMEKIELFTTQILKDTVENLIKILLDTRSSISDDIEARTYRNIQKSILNFIKEMYDYKDEDPSKAVKIFFDICQSSDVDNVKCLLLMSELTVTFDMKESLQEILANYDGFIVTMLFSYDFTYEVDDYNVVAVLKFMTAFHDELLKCHCQKSIGHLSELIKSLNISTVKKLRRHLSLCLSKYNKLIDVICLEIWTDRLPIKDITDNIEKNNYLPKHYLPVEALKIMLDIFDLKNPNLQLTTLNIYATKWAKIILKTYATGYVKHLKAEMSYLTDLMSVSLRFLTVTDIKCILKEGHRLKGVANERMGVEFAGFFISIFDKYLVAKPFLLLNDDMTDCVTLINDVVRISVRKRCNETYCDRLLELVDQIWPSYSEKSTFKQKYNLLLDLKYLTKKLGPHSNPMNWVKAVISGDACVEEKAAVIGVLPGGSDYGPTYTQLVSSLPARLSECGFGSRGVWLAALGALADTHDVTLLGIVATLVAGAGAGWWAPAVASCATSLSRSLSLYSSVYEHCWTGVETTLCTIMMVPMLRYSTTSNLVSFISTKLNALLSILRTGQKSPSLHYSYLKCVVDNTRALDILQVVFEKVPPQVLESPTSALYSDIQTDKSWQLVRDACKLCVTLRSRVTTVEGASPALEQAVRNFHCSAYNCMCACICVWKPDDKIYQTILDLNVWTKIVNCNEQYELPLRAHWNQVSISKTVSIPLEEASDASTSRSRMFLRTLSENPLLFDMIDQDTEQQVETTDLQLTDSELNAHPCAATLTALFRHLAAIKREQWGHTLKNALESGERNVRWLLAQAVCNSKEELKPHASVLAPGLVAVVADTAVEENGKKVLNNLHVDILRTLTQWEPDIQSSSQLNAATEHLITTCLINSHRQSINRTLLDVISKVLEKYAAILKISWSVFESYVKDPTSSKSTFIILKKVTQNLIYIPELIPQLIVTLSRNCQGYQLSKLAEVFGLAIKCLENQTNDNQGEGSRKDNDNYMTEFRKLLNKLKKTNVSDFIKLVHYSACCDESQFRTIVDLVQKLPQAERNKCIEIISKYISLHPDATVIDEMPHELRVMVDDRSSDRIFEEFLEITSKSTLEPAPKRARMSVDSAILNTLGKSERSFSEVLAKLSKKQASRVVEKLSTRDMSVRLTECFYVYIYIPLVYRTNEHVDLSACLSTFFNALFKHLKSNDKFKECKLRDTPLKAESETVLTKILTNTKSYAGTLKSFSYKRNKETRRKNKDTNTVLDVTITIESILDTFLRFAKTTPEVSLELLMQLLNSVTSSVFDSRPVIAQMFSKLISRNPVFIVNCRSFVDELCLIDGIKETVTELRHSLSCTEAEDVMKLLCEEVLLRTHGEQLFVMGITDINSTTMDTSMENEEFSVEELVSTFKKLSNWDCLRIQEKKFIESTGIPHLWTEPARFSELIHEYTDSSTWFGKMVELYKNNKQDSVKWVKEIDRYPKRHFELSAITEALQWHETEHSVDNLQLPTNIKKKDCIAEWAGRLMIRSAYLSSVSDEDNEKIVLSRSHELGWCERATEMALPSLSLQCIKKRTIELNDNETLPWLEQKVRALRMTGIMQNDTDIMKSALEKAEKYTNMFYNQSSPESILGLNKLMLQLNYDLNSLNTTNIKQFYEEIDTQFTRLTHKVSSNKKMKENMTCVHDTVMMYYEDVITQDDNNFKECFDQMLVTLQRAMDLKIDRDGSYIAMILNRIDEAEIDSEMFNKLVKLIKKSIKKLPTHYAAQIRAKLNTVPNPSGGKIEWDSEEDVEKTMKCLQLVCDPENTLMLYCNELDVALSEQDEYKWCDAFRRMKAVFFENDYIGDDFLPLLKYKKKLKAIERYDATDARSRQSALQAVARELAARPRAARRLAALCPDLTHIDTLPHGPVHAIHEQVKVYTDAVSRPCVISVTFTNGQRRRYIIKREPLKRGAAAECVAAFTPTLGTDCTIVPLSDDCGIITYLENHVRLREVISTVCKLDEVAVVRQSRKEDELVLSPTPTSLQYHSNMCGKVPAYSLRKGIENECATIEEFINKKYKFEASLAVMTFINWIFGLGDRHLNNIMYSTIDGSIQCIDWGAIFKYGGEELPAVRLTRNMLAVCDLQVFESRLQRILSEVRSSYRLLFPIIDLCFENTGKGKDFLPYIKGLIKGSVTSHHVTTDMLRNSTKAYKEKCIELLDVVCDGLIDREEFTVEEQVSILLKHSTDPRILSITRSGWEPWV